MAEGEEVPDFLRRLVEPAKTRPHEENFVQICFQHGATVYNVSVPIANARPADESDENKRHLLSNIDEAVRDAKSIVLDKAKLKRVRR